MALNSWHQKNAILRGGRAMTDDERSRISKTLGEGQETECPACREVVPVVTFPFTRPRVGFHTVDSLRGWRVACPGSMREVFGFALALALMLVASGCATMGAL